jgi:hypothetical protein
MEELDYCDKRPMFRNNRGIRIALFTAGFWIVFLVVSIAIAIVAPRVPSGTAIKRKAPSGMVATVAAPLKDEHGRQNDIRKLIIIRAAAPAE